MENIQQAAALVVMVLAIFAGVGIPWAIVLDRRDQAEYQARKEQNQSEGTLK